jgi:hypothetical protein
VKGESIRDWLVRNNAKHPKGNYLTGNDSERNLEFVAVNGRATEPVDTRLSGTTAQFIAGASYGPLQSTLQIWTNRNKRRLMDPLLSIDQRPIYDVASGDWSLGVSLGAVFHVDTARRLGLTCDPCSDKAWQSMWSKILFQYNTDGPAYKVGTDNRSTIVRNSSKYEPK